MLVYGLVLVAFCAWHKQPWPYFFVILIPTVFVLLVYFFDSEVETRRLSGMRLRWPALALYGLLGIAYPLTRVPVNLTRDSSFQRHMVLLADEILDKDDSYLAAVDILYNRRQGVAELAWIDKPRYLALSQMTSNELTPILERLERAPPKLVFDTYRIKALPEPLHKSLQRGFQHLWGCLYVYSPVVRPEVQQLNIKFEGRYRLESPEPALVWIANRQLRTGETIELEPGLHSVRAQTEFRMTLLPGGIAPLLDPRYRFPQVFFPNVYDY